MKKKIGIITFVLIFLSIFSLHILNQIPGIYAEKREKTLDTYPTTPEGVLETYCHVDFNGGVNYWNRIKKYTVWEDAPGWDITILVLSYNVRKIKEDNNRAQVIVEYNTVGEYYWDAIGPVFNEIKQKEVVIFNLIKKDKLWKIESPQEPPHLNVQNILRGLDEALKEETDLQKRRRIEKVFKNIKNSLKGLKN